jgi:hypothetical protein
MADRYERRELPVKVLAVERREGRARGTNEPYLMATVHYQVSDGEAPRESVSFDSGLIAKLEGLAAGAVVTLDVEDTISRSTVRGVSPAKRE